MLCCNHSFYFVSSKTVIKRSSSSSPKLNRTTTKAMASSFTDNNNTINNTINNSTEQTLIIMDEEEEDQRRRQQQQHNNSSSSNNNNKIELICGYENAIMNLIKEIDNTFANDEIQISVYVFEDGTSTENVIKSLRRALDRKVCIKIKVDGSPVSKFTRWWERSTTLVSKLRELETEWDNKEEFMLTESTVPTHAKYATFRRKTNNGGVDTGILGGINIGDRFTNWRDFTVQVTGKALVEQLTSSINDKEQILSSSSRNQNWTVEDTRNRTTETKFVSNNPTGMSFLSFCFPQMFYFPGQFDVKKSFEAILNDSSFDDYTFSIAYLDSSGVRMIRKILDRNASVTICIPESPNVYHHANRKALAKLKKVHELIKLRSKTSAPSLRIKMLPDMLHAKAFVAKSTNDPGNKIATIGSCNFRQRSFSQFQELNIISRDERFVTELENELNSICFGSFDCDYEEDFLFDEPRASMEEFFG